MKNLPKTRICTICKKRKILLNSFWRAKRRSGLIRFMATCKKCLYEKHKPMAHESKLRARIRNKYEIMSYYCGGPPKCQCSGCAETDLVFLTIDHINNDGNTQRKSNNGIQFRIYRWLIINHFPPGYQVLCWNCNIGKHINGGVCPHQKPSNNIDFAKKPGNRKMDEFTHLKTSARHRALLRKLRDNNLTIDADSMLYFSEAVKQARREDVYPY